MNITITNEPVKPLVIPGLLADDDGILGRGGIVPDEIVNGVAGAASQL